MILDATSYKNFNATALAADPFFQEWVFHPRGQTEEFWLHVLLGDPIASAQMQLAQTRLLQYSTECYLIAAAIEAYSRMKTELANEANSESCFAITTNYWGRVQKKLYSFEFCKNVHEIQFFKVIKPLFTGEREYFSLRHHAELFGNCEEGNRFWERQPLRLEKFKMENELFYTNYISGECSYDEGWYCRNEFRDQSSHDALVAGYLGMLRYLHYVKRHLQEI